MASKRVTEYNPRVHPLLIRWMLRSGLTEAELRRELMLTRTQWDEWKTYPQIRDRLHRDKSWVDNRVEDSLLRRALGYRARETTVVRKPVVKVVKEATKTAPAETVTELEIVERKSRLLAVHPDVSACMFWLRNRRPDVWKEVLKNEFTGKDEETMRAKKETRRVLDDPGAIKLANALARRVAGAPADG